MKIVSYLAPNWFWFYKAIAAAIDRSLSTQTQISQHWCEPLNDSALLNAELDLAFICGLPFIRHARAHPDQFQALVAPVMRSPRYQNRPVYFSDVIVRSESNIQQFADLVSQTFCYNDPGSNSGYYLLLHHLVEHQYPVDFFGQFVQSGSHQRSIRAVIAGQADCAAIDSIVLDQELQNHPDLVNQIRVIKSIGSVPVPPLIAAQQLQRLDSIRSLLLHPDQELRSAMDRAGVDRFAAVRSEDYDLLFDRYSAVLTAGYDVALNTALL
jgi:phosphonate transport system substrate-binding protein